MMNKRTEGKIKSHFGMSDYYKHYKKVVEKPVNYNTYSNVIAKFNESIMDLILNNSFEYRLPNLGLTIDIRKDKRKPQIKNGKLYHNSPIDFRKTMQLWNSDEDAKLNKIKVRYLNHHTNGYVFRIYCHKFRSSIKNKSYYKFKPSRLFQRSLASRINDDSKDRFDCYLLHKEKK